MGSSSHVHEMLGWSRLTKHNKIWERNDPGHIGRALLWGQGHPTMRDLIIREETWSSPADRAGTDTLWLPWSTSVPLSQAVGTAPQAPQAHCSHKTAPTCWRHVVTPCLGDYKGSVVSAVTIPSILPTQEGDSKLTLLPTLPDQHHPGQRSYTQNCQPAAVKCPHRSYTFPHK